MDRSALECPVCGVAMEVGFVPDRGRNSIQPGYWVAGAPEKSFWSGVVLKGKPAWRIETWRCPRCGRLAAVAREPA